MKNFIPFFKTNYDKNEFIQIKKVINSGTVSMGPVTEKFENEISKKLKLNKDCVALVSNCTSALHLALLSSKIKPGDEVLCSSLTFVADANSILYVGAKPVFVDIESKINLNMSVNDLKKKITKKTKAIIMTHYAGYPCQIEIIKSIAKKNNLILIEDACHTIFSKYKNKYLGLYGNYGVFSLYGNKNMTTGEGGIIISAKENINKIKKLRNHGIEKSLKERFNRKNPIYNISNLGFNYRIDDLRSSLGISQIKKIDKLNSIRKKKALDYCKLFEKKPKYVKIAFKDLIGKDFSYHLFVILLPKNVDRKKLINFLFKNGIETSVHYKPIHEFNLYKKRKIKLKKLDQISKNILSLPIYPKLKFSDQKRIVNKIFDFINL